MIRKWKIAMLPVFLMVSILSACNVNNNEPDGPDKIDEPPVQNEDEGNTNDPNQGPESFNHDEDPDQTDQQLQKGNDLQFDSDRGAD